MCVLCYLFMLLCDELVRGSWVTRIVCMTFKAVLFECTHLFAVVALLDGRVVQLKWNADRVRTIRTCRSFVVSNDTAAGPLQHERNLAQGLVNMCKMRAALASLSRLGRTSTKVD